MEASFNLNRECEERNMGINLPFLLLWERWKIYFFFFVGKCN